MRRFTIVCLAMLTVFSIFSFGQSITGRIVGTVTDSSGAIIPNATVKITNTQTNSSIEITSGPAGEYSSTPLAAATYSMEVSAQGFRKYVRRDLKLNVNDVLRIDAQLQPGQVSETVEVTGAAPQIQTDSSQMGAVIGEQKIINLPLNGRNFTQLATLTPGVTRGIPGSNADGSNGNTETLRQNDTGSAAISANGLREQNNNFQLDGIDNNESIVNTIVFFPQIEALQEFRVITNAAPAEFGRGGGAIVNAVTKSGTNQWHGSAFEFYRSSALSATPGRTVNNNVPQKVGFLRNQFGGTLGGPIIKNKTFFFVDYQGLRQHQPKSSGFVTVPTMKMRNGDFSELLDPNFAYGDSGCAPNCAASHDPIIIYNPATGLPYAGNIITDPLNPVGQAYLNVFPQPSITTYYRHNYRTTRVQIENFDDGDIRLDHKFSDNDQFFARFSMASDPEYDPGNIPGYHAGFGSGTNRTIARSWMANYVHTFDPTVLNEFRVGWLRDKIDFQGVGESADQNTPLGIPWPVGTDPAERVGISLIGGGDGQWIEYLGTGGPYRLNEKANQFTDNLSWSRGKHNFKFGATMIRRAITSFQSDLGKGFYWYPDAIAGNTPPPAGRTGFEVSEMLIGRAAHTVSARVTPTIAISWESGVFAQDDWRVNRRLTVNIGLRYEIFTPPSEKFGRMANYDPVNNVLITPGNGGPRALVATDYNDWGPRAGFAYDLTGDGKTVFRGSYGLFYALDRGGISNSLTQNPPYNVLSNFGDYSQYAVTSACITSGGCPQLSDAIPGPPPPSFTDASGMTVRYRPFDSPNTRVHQFNGTIERQLTSNIAATVAYVGTRASNALAVTNNGGGTGGFSGTVRTIANVAMSQYDALQVNVNQRAANEGWMRGLSYMASYTFSKATNNAPGPFPGPNGNNQTTPRDAGGLAYGLADYDIPHRFTWAGTYEIPFMHDAKGFVGNVIGGWTLNSIITIQKGTPFTIYNGDNNSYRAAVSGDIFQNVPEGYWFNPSPTLITNATNLNEQMPRNAYRGPGYSNVDFSIFKHFSITERTKFEFRAEMFNVFNHPQLVFGNAQTVGSGSLGRLENTRFASERQIQMGGRIYF